MLVTLCTIRQLPQAITLADSFVRYADEANGPVSVVIGLADDPTHLPTDFISPYPLLPVAELLSAAQLTDLSAAYTPTEFAAACKPRFIAEIFRRYPAVDQLLYADPNIRFFSPVQPVWEQLTPDHRTTAVRRTVPTLLLTPHITRPPADTHWPDEKFFQNVGLYSSDFLAFRRSAETDRLLAWWQDRVQQRAYVDFCAGLCTDQLWLMHVPVFFRDVAVVKNPGWHVALWNLPERTVRQDGPGWVVSGPTGQNQALLFANFKGLYHYDDGFFSQQNRLRLNDRPYLIALLNDYRQAVATRRLPAVSSILPAYGQRPEPVVLRGWRQTTVRSLRAVARFIDQVPLPRLR